MWMGSWENPKASPLLEGGQPSVFSDYSQKWEIDYGRVPFGRCGPLFYDAKCTGAFSKAGDPEYCNEANGWCGTSEKHRDAQPSTEYDYAPPR
jgi:hypothetical protein